MIDPKRYPAEVFFSDEDEGYIALARDLPGCSAYGETQEGALSELQHAIEAWQVAAQAAGNPIPQPSKPVADPLPSGKILLRTPRSLHAALIEAAKRESVSLNQHLVSVLSASTASTALLAQYSEQLSEVQRKISNVSRAQSTMTLGVAAQHSLAVAHIWEPSFLDIDYARTGETSEMIDASKFVIATTNIGVRKYQHG